MLALYTDLLANFIKFIKRLYATVKYLYNSQSEFLICGDIIVDYISDNNW
jgi:hypothetical protein